MAIDIVPYAQCPPERLRALEEKMIAFYRSPQADYYQQADVKSTRYTQEELPFHWDLLEHLAAGMLVGEIGCGTGHFGVPAMARGAAYQGWDWGEALLQRNRERHPGATFFSLDQIEARADVTHSLDMTISLYTIEHVVHPPRYLELLWRLTKPGGLIGIICPDFVAGDAFAPSIFFGDRPGRLREKLVSGRLVDLARHAYDLKVAGPAWKRRALTNEELPAFWMNLRPRILEAADYTIDTDAVHLPSLPDLRSWMKAKGAEVLVTSQDAVFAGSSMLSHSLYVLARKPA